MAHLRLQFADARAHGVVERRTPQQRIVFACDVSGFVDRHSRIDAVEKLFSGAERGQRHILSQFGVPVLRQSDGGKRFVHACERLLVDSPHRAGGVEDDEVENLLSIHVLLRFNG